MKEALEKAVDSIRRGNVVIYPTETFFAIGCGAFCESAVARIYELKKRRPGMPLPLILGSAGQLAAAASLPSGLEDDVLRLTGLWPAPLTLLLPASDRLPPAVTAGSGKIAVRVSPHSAAQALAIRSGTPIISTSANISGRDAVTRAKDLDRELLLGLGPEDTVLDLPPAPGGGSPSTIIEPLGRGKIRILRNGAFDRHVLERAGFTFISEEE